MASLLLYSVGQKVPLPDSKGENMTSQLEKYLSHCKKNMWAGVSWLVWLSVKNKVCHNLLKGKLIRKLL